MLLKARFFGVLALGLLAKVATAQLSWLGGTATYNMGSQIPTVGAYMQPMSSVTVSTQTFPIAAGQSVVAVVTTDNWQTQREIALNFDGNAGNNTKWYGIIGPYPQGTNVQFYLRANGTGNTVQYDNNGGQNFQYTWRYSPAARRGAILQWFATDYKTMLKRLPEVVQAGYGSIYLPPPSKSGGGGFSAGYNPIDRFDLGDRLLSGTVKTRFGSTEELQDLIRAAKRYGLEVYCDLIINHNDNRGSWAINRYPDMIPEDFHIRSSADTGNNEIDFNNATALSFAMLNHELVGLVDIAHENGNLTQTGAFNLPPFAEWNMWGKPWFVRQPTTPQYYPGGVPVKEDVREYLRRWCWWLSTVVGFDGFRVDALKHVNPRFMMKTQGQAGYDSNNSDLLPSIYAANPNAYVFSEVFSTNTYELREYAKTGTQLLDFNLKQKLSSLFNSSGFGDLSELSNGFGIDSTTGVGFQNGGLDATLGVNFIQSHDDTAPVSNNLASAFALTRPGGAVVYYDGNNLNPSDYGQFPRPGRYDSLGNGSDYTLKMVEARNRFGRGTLFNRWVSDKLYVYERHVNGQATMLVGLNIRGDLTALTQTVATAFAPGTVLEDLSGQQPNVTVNGSGQVTITVPSNSTSSNNNNARGYVLYAPLAPKPNGTPVVVSDADSGSVYTETTYNQPTGSFAQTNGTQAKRATISGNRVTVGINTTTDGNSAFVMLDNGKPGAWYSGLSNTPEGLTDGYIATSKLAPGSFRLTNFDISKLEDGLHVFKIRVFADTGSRPGVFSDFYYWFDVRRGLGTGWTIDGNLSEFGTQANWWQQRTPSSSSNRLDGIFLSNDDQYLYIGLAGRVDPAEGLINGMSLLIDPAIGSSGGVNNLALLNDDSGPATRLLSNTRLSLPSGFAAKMALSSFRHSVLSTSPESALTGLPTLPKTIGAEAGTWRIDPNKLSAMIGVPSSIAMQPRVSPTGSLTGLEAAIPLRSIFPNGAQNGQAMGFLAYLGTTGEAGSTLLSTDPLRGTLGGRPEPVSWISNQLLPTQSNVQNDPGTVATSLPSYLTYQPMRAVAGANVAIRTTAYDPVTQTQLVGIRNNGSTTLNGPVWVVVTVGAKTNATVVNKQGDTLYGTPKPYCLARKTSLAPKQEATILVKFAGVSGSSPLATYSALFGRGAL
jgi:glycosidase